MPRHAEPAGKKTWFPPNVVAIEKRPRGLRQERFGTCRMSKLLPAGNGWADGSGKGSGGSAASVVPAGAMCSTEAAQQAHVHRTQNPGQPLSGADSLVPIGQFSR